MKPAPDSLMAREPPVRSREPLTLILSAVPLMRMARVPVRARFPVVPEPASVPEGLTMTLPGPVAFPEGALRRRVP